MSLQGRTFVKKYLPFIFAACLIIGSLLFAAGRVFSQAAPDGTSPAVTGITTGRAWSIVGGIIAIISLGMGWRAKARANSAPIAGAEHGGRKQGQAIIALLLGGIAILLSVVHLSVSAGAVFGSGSGKAGAIVTLVLALAGTALSGLALRAGKA
ncbi:DUF6223 family protein [Chitinophaga japonensis]|uniref:DUF6223 family protein n=1 Tax=Chitinophaga japonensis TaxID=104662 RepID=UPI0011AA00DE|nr:DUF6223 family protein [Chitinophaga japonensis]